jgi:hypothetical protein
MLIIAITGSSSRKDQEEAIACCDESQWKAVLDIPKRYIGSIAHRDAR